MTNELFNKACKLKSVISVINRSLGHLEQSVNDYQNNLFKNSDLGDTFTVVIKGAETNEMKNIISSHITSMIVSLKQEVERMQTEFENL